MLLESQTEHSNGPKEDAVAVGRFRKKPVEIEAIQYLPHETCHDVWVFMGWDWNEDEELLGTDDAVTYHSPNCQADAARGYAPSLFIETLEGLMEAKPGDWIIKGEFYPCKPDIFEATYEPVDAA